RSDRRTLSRNEPSVRFTRRACPINIAVIAPADPRSDPMSEPSPTAEVMPPPAAPAPKKPARLPWDLMIGLVVGVGIAYLGVVYAFPDRKPEPDTKNTLEPVRLRAAAPRLDDVLYVGR